MSDLLPCPFCGTNPEDEKTPYKEIWVGDHLQIEYGECQACWPMISREQIDAHATDAEIAALFNRRAPLPTEGAKLRAPVFQRCHCGLVNGTCSCKSELAG